LRKGRSTADGLIESLVDSILATLPPDEQVRLRESWRAMNDDAAE
jgi:hypothetical protein